MNLILRNFFYAFGLMLLWAMASLDPNTAQFKDALSLLHASNFWNMVEVLTVVLLVIDVIMGGWRTGAAKSESNLGSGRSGSGKEASPQVEHEHHMVMGKTRDGMSDSSIK